MHRVEILLPVNLPDGTKCPPQWFHEIREQLTERFGGMTAYDRAPAEGLWKEGEQQATRDEIVIFEVMDRRLDYAWWREYRLRLEAQFRQQQLIVRAQAMELL